MAFLPLQASKYSNFNISSISKQFSVSGKKKCLFALSYDKNISTFWKKRTFTARPYWSFGSSSKCVSKSQWNSLVKWVKIPFAGEYRIKEQEQWQMHWECCQIGRISYQYRLFFLRSIAQFLHKFTWIVSSVHKLNKLGSVSSPLAEVSFHLPVLF